MRTVALMLSQLSPSVMGGNVIVQITDSLPQKESSFKEVLEELKAQVQSALGEKF